MRTHTPRTNHFRSFLLCLVATTTGTGGCVHNMQVRNLDEFRLTAHSTKRHTVHLNVPTAGPAQPYGEMINAGLAEHASVEHVVLGGEPKYEARPDANVRADVTVEYEGSGANFPITFPGFLLFAHAWNGYVYKANIVTDLSVTLAGSAEVHRRTLKTRYDMRHCDFGRGFWSSSGWFLPGWGATSLIAGVFMISYDTDATPKFNTVVREAYGSYVANNVAELLAEAETRPHAALNSDARPAPVAAELMPSAQTAKAPSAAAAHVPPAVRQHPAPSKPVVASRKQDNPSPPDDDDAYNAAVWRAQEGVQP